MGRVYGIVGLKLIMLSKFKLILNFYGIFYYKC